MAIPVTIDGTKPLEEQEPLIQDTERRMFVRLDSISAHMESGVPFNQLMFSAVSPEATDPLSRLVRGSAGQGARVIWQGQMYASGVLTQVSAVR